MIKTKDELIEYIKADMIAIYGFEKKPSLFEKIYSLIIPVPWKFQILMRKAEYYSNSNKILNKLILSKIAKIRYQRYGAKCGFSIPLNIFGPGLCIGHIGTIVINKNVKFGANTRIQTSVNIGGFSRFNSNKKEWNKKNAPKFGNNIYIGPGAKIFGNIEIGDNVAIGANATVFKSIPNNSTVVGINNILLNKGSIDMLHYGDKKYIPNESYLN